MRVPFQQNEKLSIQRIVPAISSHKPPTGLFNQLVIPSWLIATVEHGASTAKAATTQRSPLATAHLSSPSHRLPIHPSPDVEPRTSKDKGKGLVLKALLIQRW